MAEIHPLKVPKEFKIPTWLLVPAGGLIVSGICYVFALGGDYTKVKGDIDLNASEIRELKDDRKEDRVILNKMAVDIAEIKGMVREMRNHQ